MDSFVETKSVLATFWSKTFYYLAALSEDTVGESTGAVKGSLVHWSLAAVKNGPKNKQKENIK
jgi:hypothetical protein